MRPLEERLLDFRVKRATAALDEAARKLQVCRQRARYKGREIHYERPSGNTLWGRVEDTSGDRTLVTALRSGKRYWIDTRAIREVNP